MKLPLVVMAVSGLFTSCYSQEMTTFTTNSNKHQFYMYWGWNADWYTNSDIHFHGNTYDFTLARVVAHDRQTPFGIDPYFSPGRISIPQTNLRIGYFLTDHWSISLGLDHMKYVMDQDQTVNMTGTITNENNSFDGIYNNTPIQLTTNFLCFEHTDGLNYVNVELRRHDNLVNLRRYNLPNIDINMIEGFGIGALVPKTNTVLLHNERYDEFHLAGYGLGGFVGINITFFKYFFIQSEVKAGYINMPDIRTTKYSADRASQHFFFLQSNFVFGANFRLWNPEKITKPN